MPKYNVHQLGNTLYYINVIQVVKVDADLAHTLLEQCDIAVEMGKNTLLKCRYPIQEVLACQLETRNKIFHSLR